MEQTDEKCRVIRLEEQGRQRLDPELWIELQEWASNRESPVEDILLQFVRARPERNPTAVEQAIIMLQQCMQWRKDHQVRHILMKRYDEALQQEIFRRMIHVFYFGNSQEGHPIFYNNSAARLDPDYADLVPGRLELNDLSVLWLHCMEYREQYLFPRASAERGATINKMIVIMDLNKVGLGILRFLKLLKHTVSLSEAYYPETVERILIVNAPFVLNALLYAASALIPADTLKKIASVRSNGFEEIMEMVGGDTSKIPLDHGGTGPSKNDLNASFVHDLRRFQSNFEEKNHEVVVLDKSFDNLVET